MNTLKRIVCVLLAFLMFVSLIFGILSLTTYYITEDPDYILDRTVDGEYDEAVHQSVNDGVARAMMLISLQEYVFTNSVSNEEIDEISHQTLLATYKKLFLDPDTVLPVFESQSLKEAIVREFEIYASENGLVLEDGSAEEVYEYLCSDVTYSLRAVGEGYIEKLSGLPALRSKLIYGYAAIAAAVVFAAGIILLRRRDIVSGIHMAIIPVYFSSFIVFVLSSMLLAKNYIANISLADSLLRELMIRFYDFVFGEYSRVSLIVLIPAAVLTIGSIILLAVFDGSPRKGRVKRKKRVEANADGAS